MSTPTSTDLMHLRTTSQVANELGLSDQLIRHAVRVGRLRPVRSPHGALFERAEIERFRRDRETRAAKAPSRASARPADDQLVTTAPHGPGEAA